jgi:hypothetical protein
MRAGTGRNEWMSDRRRQQGLRTRLRKGRRYPGWDTRWRGQAINKTDATDRSRGPRQAHTNTGRDERRACARHGAVKGIEIRHRDGNGRLSW